MVSEVSPPFAVGWWTLDRKGICIDQGGCQEETPCLLVQVKLCWTNAGFSYFDSDIQIFVKIVNLKQNFDKKRRNKRIKENQKQEYRQKFQNTTLNLALSLFRLLAGARPGPCYWAL